MAYRLFSVESERAAAVFVHQQYPQLADKSITFRPRAAQPKRYSGDDAEALVLVADQARPGMVYVSSFEEMEAAQSFIRFEEKNGLDPNLVTTYWGVPQTVGRFAGSGETAAALVEAAASAIQPVAVGKVQAAAVPRPVNLGPSQGRKPDGGRRAEEASPREGIVDSIRTWEGWPTIRARVTAVAILNSDVHEVIRKDPIAESQARAIIAAAAAASALGAFWFGPLAVISYAVMGVVGWLAGAYLTHWVGTRLFTGRRADDSRLWLFKSLGFAQAPRLVVTLGLLLPGLGLILALAGSVWTLAASVAATEETLEIDGQSALLAALTGWLGMFAIAYALPLMLT
jgi:hypothetical protein